MTEEALGSWGQIQPKKELELPSGAKVLVRELDILEIVRLGLVDKIDSFTARALPKSETGGKDESEGADLFRDPEKMAALTAAIDAVVVASVVKPKVHPQPADAADILEGRIYVHLIPFADRMEIFNHSFKSLEAFGSFRGQQAAVVGAIPASPLLANTTEPDARFI